MKVPENGRPHKSLEPQSPDSKSPENVSGQVETFRVRRPPADKFVRLRNGFIQSWCRVLHPLAFMVYCILEMWADFRPSIEIPGTEVGKWPFEPLTQKQPNPKYGHTNGYHTVSEISKLTGTTHTSVDRSLRELLKYGLLTEDQPEP